MIARAKTFLILALAAGTLAAGPAQPPDPAEEAALIRLKTSSEVGDREKACDELAQMPKHGATVYPALAKAASDDLSDRVRLAAVKALLAFPEGSVGRHAQDFLQNEPGPHNRIAFVLALATAPLHLDDPEITRAIASILTDDFYVDVRRTAAAALGERGDPVALASLRRAADKDADKIVRASAQKAIRILTTPKAAPKPPPPPEINPDAIKGQDPCASPAGWCECAGIIRRAPKCRTRSECHAMYNGMLQAGISCTWNGRDLATDLDDL